MANVRLTGAASDTDVRHIVLRFADGVFPVLEGDRLIGRIDAKAFKEAGALRVKAFWPEVGVKLGQGRAQRLEAELDRLARFAGCDRVEMLDGWLRETLG